MIDRRKIWTGLFSALASFALLLVLIQSVGAGSPKERAVAPSPALESLRPLVITSSRNDLSPPLCSIRPRLAPQVQAQEIPRFVLPKALGLPDQAARDLSIVQDELPGGPAAMPAPIQNFDGISNLFLGWPPDTQGDIGPNHYVQWVNLHFALWEIDRVNDTASLVCGPFPGNSLFQGFGGYCESTNSGDPITLYDPFADRWFMSQFALPFYPNGPFFECIAVSATEDPTGPWNRYEFQMPVDKMNDYPKFGVWPDAYYMTVNQFNGGSLTWGGAGVAALERSAMLVGDPARMVYYDLYSVNPNFGGILPADFDGFTPPPAESPGYFAEWDDGASIPSLDALRLWEFHVDWDEPGDSTFGLDGEPNQVIPTADVDPSMCGTNPNCIPQPGASSPGLDAISDRLMHRLQYRNFSGYETLVSNHTVDVDGTDHAGVHWLELRSSAGTWSLHQEGVYAPDDDHRWMGSVALDHNGNLALGYSVSSHSTYPSVRYTGRLAGDPLGALPQGEVSLIEGSGSQTGSNRWGDYSMMAVDPLDDCTFWYTQEYVEVTGSNTWKTRIGSFRFPSCSIGPQGTLDGTVTDSVTSLGIDGAQVLATASLTQTLYTLTQEAGLYEMQVPTGTYTVTASAFGYQSDTVFGVDVFSGTVTTQDFALDPATSYLVSGQVYDANTGWPLYAQINIGGAPLDPIWTDPVTGEYSISLPEGIIYTFEAQAFGPGYLSSAVEVGPLTGDLILDIPLDVDEFSCSAPGYEIAFTPLFVSDFEADNGGLVPSGTTSWSWGVPSSGPGGAYSGDRVWATNLSGEYSIDEYGDLTLPPVDLSAYAGQTPVITWWQWLQTEPTYDFASLEVSKDGGGIWTTAYGPVDGNVDLEWAKDLLILDSSYAVADFMARFHFTSDHIITAPGWYLDDVGVGLGSCEPLAGGLVVGNVYDDNTSLGLNGAAVTNDSGRTTTSQATPLDTGIPDGFYTLFSPAGSHVFTATMGGGYQAVEETVSVPLNDTIQGDFDLPAGWLLRDPLSLDISLEMGTTATLPLTVTNQGGIQASFEIIELDKGVVPMGPFEEPSFVVKPFKGSLPTTERLKLPDPPYAAPLEAGDVIRSWTPTGVLNAWGLAYDGFDDTLWLSSTAPSWGGDDTIYEFTPQGVSTGRSHPHTAPHIIGPVDMAYNWNTGMLWVMNVNPGVANCIYEVDPASGYTGEVICPGGGSGFASSQRGLAYDPSTDTWFAGGWLDLMVYRFDSLGNILNSVNTGLPISGLAYNPETEHLFAMLNDSPNLIYVLDAADNYAILGQFSVSQGFGPYSGAGLEFDCEGNLWAVDQDVNTVYQFESGEGATLCTRDVSWLSETPSAATLPSPGEQVVEVDFDSSVPEVDQPGIYHAQLKFIEDTPYDLVNVPVTMTVDAPLGWGKLEGTVNSLGYCDGDPAPLQDAEVTIESSSGVTWTLGTDVDGGYQRWLDQVGNPYTVTVKATEHTDGQASGVVVVGGEIVTRDFDLHWLQPCVSHDPDSLSVALKQGKSVVLPLTISNVGYAPSDFELLEIPLEPLSPEPGRAITAPLDEDSLRARSAPSLVGSSAPIHIPRGVETLIDESFEGGEIPPAGWSQEINSASTWTISTISPHSGSYYAHVSYNYDQDEWLLTPELHLAEGMLSFWSFGSLYWCRDTYDNCDLNVWIVVGEVGGGDDIFVGRADDSWASTYFWSQSVFNLTPLAPSGLVRIGFQYLGSDGAEIALDDILMEGIEGGDVPWLSTSPISGTLATTGEQIVDVTFDSGVPEAYEPGDYNALLLLKSEDPWNDNISIPISMTVIPLVYGVDLSPDMGGHDIPTETVSYTLSLTNTGEGPDTFAISLGAHLWPASLDQTMVGPLDVGESGQVTAQVQIPETALGGDSDAVVVTVTSSQDPTKSDSATLTTTADTPLADLQVIKSVSSDPVYLGSVVTYTLVITNHGPTKSLRATLVDVLPAGVIYQSNDAGCNLTGYVLTCELGTLTISERRTVKVVVIPMKTGILVNQAVITSDTEDPDPENNWHTIHTASEGYLYYFPLVYR